MKLFVTLFVFCLSVGVKSQSNVTGRVCDDRGAALIGVNVFVENSIDGAVSDAQGQFQFSTTMHGQQWLIASMVGYETVRQVVNCDVDASVHLVMKESVTSLNAVTIVAGSYDASDKKRTAVLEPLDVYITAGAVGDVSGAFRTLPGAQPAPEDGRLMVRGGEAYETKSYFDGLAATHPYDSKVPDLPTRGRFAPSLFSGTSFSTGGYSAEFGQALSSVMLLNTNDLAYERSHSLSLMSLGIEMSETWVDNDQSFSASASYYNMALYQQQLQSHMNWIHPMESGGTALMYRHKTNTGMLKAYATSSLSKMQFVVPDDGDGVNIDNKTGNGYLNVTYRDMINPRLSYVTGIASGYDEQKVGLDAMRVRTRDFDVEARYRICFEVSPALRLISGVADSYKRYVQNYLPSPNDNEWKGLVIQHLGALFAETEYHPVPKVAIRPGVRWEYNSLLREMTLAPRISAACKPGSKSQVSVAYGEFYQTPETDYLKFNSRMQSSGATHWIASFQAGENSGRLMRVELYHKQYRHLVRFNTDQLTTADGYRNSGHGYARGIDLFFRDRLSVKHLDTWLSYSFVDTRRLYQDFPESAQPSFIANHTVNVVSKYFVVPLNSQISGTYTFASGKPYHNPEESGFMNASTPAYHDVSLSWSYLTHLKSQSIIVYLSVSNVLGRHNIYGYRSHDFAGNALDEPVPIVSDQKRFVFLGLFLNLL